MEAGTEVVAAPAGAVVGATESSIESEIGPIEAKDLLSPKVLVMQPTSKLVTEGKAKMGDLVDSLTQSVIGGTDSAIEVIVLKSWKTWVQFKGGSGKPVFTGEEEYTASNSSKPREEMINGSLHTNFETHNYLVLNAKDIEEGLAVPMTLSFRSTGLMASKAIKTYAAKLVMASRMGATVKGLEGRVFTMGTEKRENDQGTFAVPVIIPGRVTTDEEIKVVTAWKEMLATMKVEVDNSDLEEHSTPGNNSTAPGDIPPPEDEGFAMDIEI